MKKKIQALRNSAPSSYRAVAPWLDSTGCLDNGEHVGTLGLEKMWPMH